MDFKTEREQRNEFCKILRDLAKSQMILKDPSERSIFYSRLEKLYYLDSNNRFRHFYSDIYSELIQIKQDPNLGSIVFLVQNLEQLRKEYQCKNQDVDGKDIDISDSIKKLYDHVNLDVARLTYSEAESWNLLQTEQISTLYKEVERAQSDTLKVKNEIEKVKGTVQGTQKEYITILGIFAAVVLTFTGGIAFSTSVLQNLHQSSIYRIVFTSSLIGLVLFNVLYALFYFVYRLVRPDGKHSIWLLVFANAILLGFMLLTCVAWFIGLVENRNERIRNTELSSASQASPNSAVPLPDSQSELVVLSFPRQPPASAALPRALHIAYHSKASVTAQIYVHKDHAALQKSMGI